ncbi:hypothetical protein MBLNU13_g01001t1 [Cladosporium sp. NU13]
MSSHQRPHEVNSEAAEPLYRDSSDEAEKPLQDDLDAQTQVLLASIRRLRRWLIAVSILLGVLSVYTLFSFRHVVAPDHTAAKRHGFAPEIPRKSVTFEKTIFAGPSTPEADEAWGNNISPPGDGFVLIPDPSAYDLPPGQPVDADYSTAKGEIYDISVFHQLHCLRHVRTFLFTLKAGMDFNSTAETYDRMLKHQEEHVYHCFDYIRQALMCNADLTVEWPRTEADGSRVAVDGWGVSHQCKNWDSVLEFMGKYQIPNAW